MKAAIVKSSIDLGIVTTNGDAMLKFYRDTLGLPHVGDMPMAGGGKMHRLSCGETVVKIVVPGSAPPAAAAPGGLQGATGLRYFTISVSNLNAMAEHCATAGCKVPVTPREIRPGVSIAMVEDPDGNWVEFLQTS